MIYSFLTVHLYTQRKEEETKKVINITDLEVTEKKKIYKLYKLSGQGQLE